MTSAVISTGATPVFADCHPRTLNIDPESIERLMTSETRAVVATSVFGNPSGLPQVASLCGQREIPMIEDVSGGIGATVDGRRAGSVGWASIIDLGEGSVIGCGQEERSRLPISISPRGVDRCSRGCPSIVHETRRSSRSDRPAIPVDRHPGCGGHVPASTP